MKKKGFTLIELLAVIVVLAIIALIAVPMIMSAIEKAKMASFRDSVISAFRQADYYIVENKIKMPEEGIGVNEIGLEKNHFQSGIFQNNEEENLRVINISDGAYCAVGEMEDLKVFKGACDLTTPRCDLEAIGEKGANNWFYENPVIEMRTSKALTGGLEYGIGKEENYRYEVENGKEGKARYQTTEKSERVYCYVKNIGNSKSQNWIEVKVDKTEPESATFSTRTTSKSITVVAGGTDRESGISRYQFSKDNGATWTEIRSNSSYTFDNLEYKEYEIKVRVYNGTYVESKKENNLKKESASQKVKPNELVVPTYEVSPKGWTKGNVKVEVKYGEEGTRLFRTSVGAVSKMGVSRCSGTNSNYTCETGTVTQIEANVWYQGKGEVVIEFSQNGNIEAKVVDGVNYKAGSALGVSNIDKRGPSVPTITYNGGSNTCSWKNNYKITLTSTDGESGIDHYEIDHTNDGNANASITSTFIPGNGYNSHTVRFRAVDKVGNVSEWSQAQHIHMDTTKPSVTVSVSGKVATFKFSDNAKLAGYQVTTNTATPSSWAGISGSWQPTWTASAAGTYYVHVKDEAGNTNYASFSIAQTAFCAYNPGQVWNFAYTGGVQSWTTPCNGTYKLEVWGAQGGDNYCWSYSGVLQGTGTGGKGGYASGNKSLNKGDMLYTLIGGKGSNATWGGSDNKKAGGGGATHIATTNRGLLSNYNSYRSDLLIVAGGGGGGL